MIEPNLLCRIIRLYNEMLFTWLASKLILVYLTTGLFNLVTSLKARCHILFTHAFYALRCAFNGITLDEPTNVSSRKPQRDAENTHVNGMWQLGLRDCFSIRVLRSVSEQRQHQRFLRVFHCRRYSGRNGPSGCCSGRLGIVVGSGNNNNSNNTF